MKLFLTALFLAAFAFSAKAQSITWSTPVPVADSTFGNTRPHVAVCNGVPVVVWGNAATDKIYASRFVNGTFTTPVDVSPDFPAYVMGWMAHEIAAAGDTLYVVFGDLSMSHIYLKRSLDGGQTFGDTVRVDDGSNGFMPVEPSVDIMAGGNPVVSFIVSELDFSNARTLVTRSTDGGTTFSAPVDATASTPGEACDCCKGMMVAAGNRSILVFRNNENNIREFYAAISENNGQTFPTSVQIDHTNWNVSVCPTSPAAGKLIGDSLVTVFMSGASGENRVYVSTLGLSNITQPVVQHFLDVPSAGVDQNYPRVAGAALTLGTVWQESSGNQSEIRFASSFTGTGGLGNTTGISPVPAGANTMPDVAYGDNAFYAVYENDITQRVFFTSGIVSGNTTVQHTNKASELFQINQQSDDVYAIRFNTDVHDAVISMTSANGQAVVTQSIGDISRDENVYISMDQLSSGMYFIAVTSHQAVSTQKLILTR